MQDHFLPTLELTSYFKLSESILLMEARRSGNYKPTIWDDNYIQSLTTPYTVRTNIYLYYHVNEK